MKSPQAPQLDPRRAAEFSAEMRARAHAWITEWGMETDARDFGEALIEVAARFNSEVAERLDGAGEKMRRGFLDWLAVRGEAARPARMPVVFKLNDVAQSAVLAAAPVRLQADAAGSPVVFETEKDVRIVPGQLQVVVGVDASNDAYYLPPPGICDLQPQETLPVEWQLKGFASAGSKILQLDPDLGLEVEMIIEAIGSQYRIVHVDKGIVTVDPKLKTDLTSSPPTTVRKVTTFTPFDGKTSNQQQHVLYLGDMELLDIEAAATIEVLGAGELVTGVTWQYWGKAKDPDKVDWQNFLKSEPSDKPGAILLRKAAGAIEPLEIGGIKSRWIRACADRVDGATARLSVDSLSLTINNAPARKDCPSTSAGDAQLLNAEGFANTTPVILNDIFFPLGKEPKQFDSFYLGCQEAFSKRKAEVQLCFAMVEAIFTSLSSLVIGQLDGQDTSLVAGQARDGSLHLFQFKPATKELERFHQRDPLVPVIADPGQEARPVTLDPSPEFRIPVWSRGTTLYMAVTSKNTVWIRSEDKDVALTNAWLPTGLIGVNEVPDSSALIASLVYLDDAASGRLFALRGSLLFTCDLAESKPEWHKVEVKVSGSPVPLSVIAPIHIQSGTLGSGTVSEGLVAIGNDNKLYRLNFTSVGVTCTQLLDNVDAGIQPAAVLLHGQLVAVAAAGTATAKKLKAYFSTTSGSSETEVGDLGDKILGNSIDITTVADNACFCVCVRTQDQKHMLVTWWPLDPNSEGVVLKHEIPSSLNAPIGAPTLLPRHVLVPAAAAQVIVASTELQVFSTKIKSAIIKHASGPTPAIGDLFAIPIAANGETHQLAPIKSAHTEGSDTLYEIDALAIHDHAPIYPVDLDHFIGQVTNLSRLDQFKLSNIDNPAGPFNAILVITDKSRSVYKVTNVDGPSRIVTLDRSLDVTEVTTIRYTSRFVGVVDAGDSTKIKKDPSEVTTQADSFLLITAENASVRKIYRVTALSAGVATLDGDVSDVTGASADDKVYYTQLLTAEVHADDLKKLTLDINDHQTGVGTLLLVNTTHQATVTGAVYEVKSKSSRVVELDRELSLADPLNPPDLVCYQTPGPSVALSPLLDLDETSGDWPATYLDHSELIFPDAEPDHIKGKVFTSQSGKPQLVRLDNSWTQVPPVDGDGKSKFLLDRQPFDWTARLGHVDTNPDLSWEYWNGKSWWKLPLILDGLQNLKASGALVFSVPDDIALSDWAGSENYWIRARLIGGDYGKEVVKVITTDVTPQNAPPNSVTQQVVERTPGSRPPAVVRLDISYRVFKEVLPQSLITQDSGTLRDQSDANRTPGAIVEAFLPLAFMLDRLSPDHATPAVDKPTDAAPATSDAAKCCGNESEMLTGNGADEETDAPASSSSTVLDRALFIGLDAVPSETPVNILLVVDERPHTAFAPMRVEALIADRFVPIVVDDATRAIGESGLLSLSFPIPPTRSELFGQRNLTWLRLTPHAATKDWQPSIRGAYLNAGWASATETLTRELLGSSTGEPNLTLHLARPPVLHQTLELRVREPLGEEDRQALIERDPKTVQSSVEGLPGDWVLWTKVVDPDDEPADSRVYALDEMTGEIRFGDGIHGRIPPIGKDSIVAFRYCRTELDPNGSNSVPANSIAPRTPLNLVSPVEGVESVTAADQSAGGAPPESDDRVLRFGFARLRHRNRIVTLGDMEDLALQSSPEIVQARAFAQGGTTRLVIVMRGRNPIPSAAQIRELHKLLLDAGQLALRAPGALRIAGPRVRRLRVELEIQIDALDHAGTLSAFIKKRLGEFFDTAVGGIDRDGWPLGLNPREEDIALALAEAPYVQSFIDIKLVEISADGQVLPAPESLKSTDLVMLDDDPVRYQFQTIEVAP